MFKHETRSERLVSQSNESQIDLNRWIQISMKLGVTRFPSRFKFGETSGTRRPATGDRELRGGR